MVPELRTLFLLLLLAACPCTFAQTCTTHVIVVPFDQKTHKGIDGLQSVDFEARMGHDALLVNDSTENLNQRLLVLVDVSGSSDHADVTNAAVKLADLSRNAPAGRKLAFGAFADRLLLTKEFSTNPAERSAEIDDVMAQTKSMGRNAGLFDALHGAIGYFGKRQPGDTIMLVSDGHDNLSKRNADDVSQELLASGIRLLTVFRPRSRFASRDFRQIARDETTTLKILTSTTGGSYTGLADPTFFDFAWAGYLLDIALPNSAEKPKTWTLHLRNRGGKGYRDAFIMYPEKIGCSVSESEVQVN